MDIIDDETLRARVRQVIAEPGRKSLWGKFTGHPLTALIVGFALTWGIGNQLSGKLNDDREAREKRVSERRLSMESSLRSIENYSNLLDEHRTRALMFLSALRRNAQPEELRDRKRMYDEAYARWGSRAQSNLLALRGALGFTDFSPVESHVLTGSITPIEFADSLLLEAYDQRVLGESPINLQRARILLDGAATCNAAVVGQLYGLLRVRLETNTPATAESSEIGVPESVPSALGEACRPSSSGGV